MNEFPVCTNGMISKTEVSASYRHISLKILNEFPKVLDNVSLELGKPKDQFRISMQTPVDNPSHDHRKFQQAIPAGGKRKLLRYAPRSMRYAILNPRAA
jgi:hypothetical protein